MASVYKDTESSYKKFCPPNLKRVPTPMLAALAWKEEVAH